MRHFSRYESVNEDGSRNHLYGNIYDVENNLFAFDVRYIGWDKDHYFFASENYGHVYRVNKFTDEVSVCWWGYDFVNDKVKGKFEPWGKNLHEYTVQMINTFF